MLTYSHLEMYIGNYETRLLPTIQLRILSEDFGEATQAIKLTQTKIYPDLFLIFQAYRKICHTRNIFCLL